MLDVILTSLPLGFVAGILSGMLGVGGGILLVPALVYLYRMEPHLAVGTSLAVIIPTAVAGTLRHYQFANVDWAVTLFIALGAIGGANLIGPQLAERLSADALKQVFGVVLLVVSLEMLGVFGWVLKNWKNAF